MIASLLEKVFERKIEENNRLHAIVKLSYKKYSNSGTKSKNSSLSNLDNGVVIKLKRWLVSLFHCCCLSSYFYFIIKYNYWSTVFISSCFYMVRKGGPLFFTLLFPCLKKLDAQVISGGIELHDGVNYLFVIRFYWRSCPRIHQTSSGYLRWDQSEWRRRDGRRDVLDLLWREWRGHQGLL